VIFVAEVQDITVWGNVHKALAKNAA